MNKTRVQLVLIIAAFALPAVIAVLLQTPWFHWDPSSTRNRGELIKPVIAMTAGTAAPSMLADGHRWSVVVRIPAQCDAGCARRLAMLANLREAQGKEMDRVQMIAWTETGTSPAPVFTSWQPDARLSSLLALPEGGVLLVDPLGNAMLRYRADADPTDVRKDLAHLLRWSKAGE